MKIKNTITRQSSIILAIFALVTGGFYLMVALLGYSFVPINGSLLNIFSISVIVIFTIIGLYHSSEKSKASVVCSALFPLLMFFLVITKGTASDFNRTASNIYIIYIFIALICSMVLFFKSTNRAWVKIGLGTVYSLLIILFFLLLLAFMLFRDFGSQTVVSSKASPNGIYLAEIIEDDQGALGGNTLVNITAINHNINLFVGVLKKDSVRIYSGDYNEFNHMTLEWETDHFLYINGEKYNIEQIF